MPPVIEVRNLHKEYGDTVAVDDVSFTVQQGEIFGILGPNGAGKTTTVECIEGLRTPDGGAIRVLGLDPRRDRAELTQRLGVQLQDSSCPTGSRSARRWSCTARSTADRPDRTSAADTLGLPGSAAPGTASCPAARSSGCRSRWRWSGARRWPILDELTTGLDPQARRETWELIEWVRASGVTILLVTHFMEEAERLCDRVALIDARPDRRDRHAGRRSRPASRCRAAHPVPPVRALDVTSCSPACPR